MRRCDPPPRTVTVEPPGPHHGPPAGIQSYSRYNAGLRCSALDRYTYMYKYNSAGGVTGGGAGGKSSAETERLLGEILQTLKQQNELIELKGSKW